MLVQDMTLIAGLLSDGEPVDLETSRRHAIAYLAECGAPVTRIERREAHVVRLCCDRLDVDLAKVASDGLDELAITVIFPASEEVTRPERVLAGLAATLAVRGGFAAVRWLEPETVFPATDFAELLGFAEVAAPVCARHPQPAPRAKTHRPCTTAAPVRTESAIPGAPVTLRRPSLDGAARTRRPEPRLAAAASTLTGGQDRPGRPPETAPTRRAEMRLRGAFRREPAQPRDVSVATRRLAAVFAVAMAWPATSMLVLLHRLGTGA
ncbi:hypothetical protein R5H30_08120 [Sulfitobacter sp. D35]|uniref:hypothetical protein n=1 Tax=Sulfitobacter sp. D35 TaxID=3083252 RepID=UPI00296EA092|nr:hypothetical protein [Sulfitobacter sp. D35]MDW4497941.1 hypothetical protein [Sulfitobacter sp. D35]